MKTKEQMMERLELLYLAEKLFAEKRNNVGKNKSYDKIESSLMLEIFPYSNKNLDEIPKIVEGEIFALNWAMGTIE